MASTVADTVNLHKIKLFEIKVELNLKLYLIQKG